MSASTQFGFGGEATRSRGEIKKHADSMYASSFGDLPEGTIYRDPLGWKTPEGSALQKSRWDQLANEPAFPDGSSVVEKWNELQRKGWSLEDTTREIRKSLDTGDWTLPVDIVPDVFFVNPEQLPMADTLARVTTQDDEVAVDALTAFPDISWDLESGSGDREYEFEQPTFANLSYDVEGYGAATRISDKMILAAANLRNAESTQEQAFVRAMRQEEERQIILGEDNDADGYEGFNDLGTQVDDLGDPDDVDGSDIEESTRELIDDAEFEGASRDNLAVVMDFESHRLLREELVDNVRYEAGTEAAGAFTTLEFDDVPVFKSHAITRISDLDLSSTETNNQIYTVNTEATYLSMLQETSVRPLARLGPQERMAVDAYGVLVSEDDGDHIRIANVTEP